MAKKRLIPKLQLFQSKVLNNKLALVATVGFSKIIEIGDPVSQAKIYEAQLADELIVVDLSPSKKFKSSNVISVLNSIAGQVFLPITIGGGVRKIEDFRILLNNGADKVAINSSILDNPDLVNKASQMFGSQCVVASIDYRIDASGEARVYGMSGSKKYQVCPLEWAILLEQMGAGEILLTCIDNDGTRGGLELSLAKKICDNTSIPVIISGGCGRAKHFIDGYKLTGADAIAAGTFFCFQDQSPMQVRAHIKNAGVSIRTQT